MTCAVRCRTHFSCGRSQPNIVLLACEEQFSTTRSLFRCFWLTTCPTVSLVFILWWCQTESYLVIIMHLLHNCVFEKSNQIIFEKSLQLYCEQTWTETTNGFNLSLYFAFRYGDQVINWVQIINCNQNKTNVEALESIQLEDNIWTRCRGQVLELQSFSRELWSTGM